MTERADWEPASRWALHSTEFVAWAEKYATGGGPRFHACLCDPPYGIAFMGKEWDDPGGPDAFQKQAREWGRALRPMLKPGALVLMFAGTRMWHRLACGMEDAGFRLWDTLMWLHGQGFPKGQDISKLIDKADGAERPVVGQRTDGVGNTAASVHKAEGFAASRETVFDETAPAFERSLPWSGHKTPQLKPAWEPVLCFRAPDGGRTYAELALGFGSGSLNVDGGRIGTTESGRYPANLALECTCEQTELMDAQGNGDIKNPTPKNPVVAFGEFGARAWTAHRGKAVRHTDPECPACQLDEQAGEKRSSGIFSPHGDGSVVGGRATDFGGRNTPASMYSDFGGPSRFFYCAKATRSEREAGLASLPMKPGGSNAKGFTKDVARGLDRNKPVHNFHPTVKPIDLNRWLASLLLPPASVGTRRILVPFAGVGSEMIGCLLAGWDEVVGVEMSAEYARIAEARLAHWVGEG